MRLNIWLLLVSSVLWQIGTSSAQEAKTFESWITEAREPEARQKICEQAYNRHFNSVFKERSGAVIPKELSGLWQACDGLLVPSNVVMQRLSSAREQFNRAFGETARWSLVRYVGNVGSPEETVSRMIETSVGLATSNGPDARAPRLSRATSDSNLDRVALAQALGSNLDKGDFLLEVTLRDSVSGETMQALNSMNYDGDRYSGYLFLTVRLPAVVSDRVELPNTVCERTSNKNIFGSPADRFEGCVRAACNSRRVTNCVVTKSECIPGPVGDCKILPDANTPGQVNQPDCQSAFRYAWSSGLKKITISNGGASFKIDGSIGQEGQGSFLAEESCVSVRPFATLSETLASDVLFDVDKHELKPEGREELESKLVKYLSQLRIISIVVEGHTDNAGAADHNYRLSRLRANTIRDYLVLGGISIGLIQVDYYGAERPIVSNGTPAGRAKNRRVEIIVKAHRFND